MRDQQLTLVVAAAGYGKTAWAESHLPASSLVLRTPDRLAGLAAPGASPDGVCVEDLHLLSSEDRARALRAVASLPPRVPVVLTTVRPLDRRERALLTRPVHERGPGDLALPPARLAALLEEEYGLLDPALPSRVHRLTAGWPALVHLLADAVARRTGPTSPTQEDRSALRSAAAPGGPAAEWLEHHLLAGLPEQVSAFLAASSGLAVLAPGLVAEVWPDRPRLVDGCEEACRTGLVVPDLRWRLLDRDAYRTVPLLRDAVAGRGGQPGPERLRLAAEWYRRHDFPLAAVRAHLAAGEVARARDLLARTGEQALAHGDAAEVVALLAPSAPAPALPLGEEERRLLGEALLLLGRTEDASAALRPLVRAADRSGWDVGLAVRVAAALYSAGDLERSAATLDAVGPEALPATGDGIRWRAQRSLLASQLGHGAQAVALAEESLRLAEESGSPADLSWARQALAKVSATEGKARHLDLAARHARAAGDVPSLARVLCNRTFTLLATARFPEAVVVGREAVWACELARPMGALAAALVNLAEALRRTGELEEARWCLRRGAELGRRLGPGRAAASLAGLGDLAAAVGRGESARHAYQQATTLARESGERQVLVPALAGMARLVAEEDPALARRLAGEATELATPGTRPQALAALALAQLGWGDRSAATETAGRAAAAAREDQALDLLAEALEVRAAVADDPDRARALLEEAGTIWEDAGAGLDACRVAVLLARLEGADRATRRRGRDAARRLHRWGVARVAGAEVVEDPAAEAVRIRVLGSFEVVVDGHRVPMQAWRSRQARTLVKLLAARRGRPVSRGRLCEQLWPDDSPVKTSHRLSVLLTTVRGVLDPDRAWPADRYVASDARGLWLDLRRVGIDADELVADAEHGAALLAEGALDQAAQVLVSVDRRYRGEAFEDEPYEEWAVQLRDEARSAWLRSMRHLATIATRQGRRTDAVAILARLLAVDPFDEQVHRGLVRTLVRAGRHGEARRAFDRWTEAMADLGVPPPDPGLLVPDRRQGAVVIQR